MATRGRSRLEGADAPEARARTEPFGRRRVAGLKNGVQPRFTAPGAPSARSQGVSDILSRLPIALLSGCAFTALAGAALADPPARVGRISDVEGQVSLLPPAQPEWVEAFRNFPVTSGEAFWTGDEGRVQLQFGGVQASVDSETELDVVDLDYGDTRLS